MSEKNAFEFGIENGELVLSLDTNKDGEPVVTLKLNLSEAVSEAFARGNSVEGVKLVSLGFEGAKLKLALDTDKDGERLVELVVDLSELADEIQDAVK